jgi:ATP-dependent protease ClpP protease subunit
MKWKSKYRNDEGDTETVQTVIESGTKDKESSLMTVGNKLYFYSDVGKESIYILNRQIDEISKHLKSVQYIYNLQSPPNIDLNISTDGGDIFAALSAVDRIKNSHVPVNTYCEGIVASAGTLISVVGKQRYISKNAFMLLHQISSSFWGTYMNFKDEMQNLDVLMTIIKTVYLEHTKFNEKDLDALLKKDICLTAKDCKKFGLVDHIIG